ncbi:hypothetical protein [Vibrio crassostreae]|uniref:hypothetical protein n=1 Tax=Vibrio crassostreae TaxID=246167 RepID=UPI0002D35EDA|nr:hypothetical protein [Vibrio crassostreae]OEE90367.1 hypothetical protein A140_03375 [Vibrio crassostreae 9ZC88]
MSYSLPSVLIYITAFSSIFYLKGVVVSPIYIYGMVCTIIFFVGKFTLNSIITITMLAFYYILSFTYSFNVAGLSDVINLLFGVVTFFMFYEKRNKLSRVIKSKHLITLMAFSIFLLVIDTVNRFVNPATLIETDFLMNEGYYYRYKINSILGHDSNFNGLLINSLLCLCVVSLKSKLISLKTFILLAICLTILCVLSLSKSAVISMLIVFLSLFFYRYLIRHSIFFFLALLFSTFLVYAIFYYLSINLELGPSFSTKVKIYSDTIEFLLEGSFDTVFGVGIHQSEVVFGRYAHTLYSIFLSEVGVIGLILFLSVLLQILILTKGVAIIFYIPLFISGLSFFPGHGFLFTFVHIGIAFIIQSSSVKADGFRINN